MDPKQPVVLQLLESLKDSYMSNDLKTCQQLLGQLKDIVDQKASLDGTDNEPQVGELSNRPLDMKSIDPNLWEEQDEQGEEHDDYSKLPYDKEWITKTNCVEYLATTHDKKDTKEDEEYEVDEEEDDAKEDEEEDDAEEDEEYEVDEEEDDAKEDEEEDDAEEDEEYVVDEEEDDDSGSEEDEEIQQPLRRSSRIKNVNATTK